MFHSNNFEADALIETRKHISSSTYYINNTLKNVHLFEYVSNQQEKHLRSSQFSIW